MDMVQEVIDMKAEAKRRAKLSVEDHLEVLSADTLATELALRTTLEEIGKDMTDLRRRIEKLEHGQVLATEFDRPLNEGRADD